MEVKKIKTNISKKEWTYVSIITLIVILISLLPLVFGYTTQGPSEVFMGVPVHVTDANNHLNMALQAKEGNILLANYFTSEDVPGLIFNPYHLVLGWSAYIFNMDIIVSYIIWGIIFSVILFFTIYYFLSSFVSDKKTRFVAFLLIALSNGFAFWWFLVDKLTGYQFGSADFWITELNTFQSLGHPHFTLSLILLLLTLLFGIKALESKGIKYSIIAGIFGFVLSLVHLFDIITSTVVLVGWFLFRQLKAKSWNWIEFRNLAIIGLIMAPGVIYYAWVFIFNSAYAEWNSLNQTITPPLIRVISGFGLVFFLALIPIWVEKKKLWNEKINNENMRAIFLLVIWGLLNFILIYFPMNVQRRFIFGLHIPLCILSAIAIIKYVLPIIKNKKLQIPFLVIILLISFATTIMLTVTQINNLHSNQTDDFSNIKYLSSSENNILDWLDQNTINSDVILAPDRLSNFIPAVSGNRIYSGHWAQTINYDSKKEIVNKVYNEKIWNDKIDAKYIVWYDKKPIDTSWKEVYSNGAMKIYELGVEE